MFPVCLMDVGDSPGDEGHEDKTDIYIYFFIYVFFTVKAIHSLYYKTVSYCADSFSTMIPLYFVVIAENGKFMIFGLKANFKRLCHLGAVTGIMYVFRNLGLSEVVNLNPNSLDNKGSCWILKDFYCSVTMLRELVMIPAILETGCCLLPFSHSC